MGEFDWGTYDYKTEGGGQFVDETYVILAIAKGSTFAITAVRDDDENTYNGKVKPRWLIDFVDDEGEEKTRGINKGIEDRDTRFSRLQQTLAATGEPIQARFVKVGKAYDIAGA